LKLWFAEHRRFLLAYAAFAQEIKADVYCIGVEFEWLTQHEAEWRETIKAIREVWRGKLTYAANFGKEAESIRFWDALDYIGVDHYYPLPANRDMTAIVDRMAKLHQRFHKPVLFTEAGFESTPSSHKEPWRDESGMPVDLEEQKRNYEALLSAFWRQPWFAGVYWWKVGTNAYGGPNNASMTPWRKPAMDVVKRYYAEAR
jgi:hypothetical protein